MLHVWCLRRDSVHVRLYHKAVDQQKRAEARKQLQSVEVSASIQVGLVVGTVTGA